jgi:hypothetical protein
VLVQADPSDKPCPDERERPSGHERVRLRVEPRPDPVIDEAGHDPRPAYVETFWLPILGPSNVTS